MYRLIALDIDGTLVKPDGHVSKANREAIARARAAGIKVVLSTGRSWQESEALAQEAGCDRLMVGQGGAALADLDQRRNTRMWQIDQAVALEILEWLEQEDLGLMVFAGDELLINPGGVKWFSGYACPAFYESVEIVERPVIHLQEQGLPLNKIHAQGDPATFPPLLERLGGYAELFVTSSARDNFEVMPVGVDKGTGLAALALEMGIGLDEVIAIGDSENDRGMLNVVGMPVAMGNASDEIKAIARHVTDTNLMDGVAKAIDHFLELQ